jgi:hypothetical protein
MPDPWTARHRPRLYACRARSRSQGKGGFLLGDDTDTARPDAWCSACEQALVALNGTSSIEWFKNADFKIFCGSCWDEAKAICGVFTH